MLIIRIDNCHYPKDFTIFDWEYDPRGEGHLDLSADWKEEPMDEDDYVILDEEEDLPSEPAEPPVPAEPEADLGLFACGDKDIFEDDPPVNPSLYTLSQLVWDINSSPSQEDPGVPAHSQVVAECLKGIPKPDDFDWVVKMNAHDKHNACQEEQEQDVRLQQDPCLPSLSAEPIPLCQGCSR